jgi:hypothetical protein
MPKDARWAELGSRNLPRAKLEPTSIHSSPEHHRNADARSG